MRAGDTLMVPSLDRLGRSLQDLISIVAGMRKRGVGFRSLHEALDTTTAGGRLVFHVFAALAELLEEAEPAAKVSIEVQDDGRVKLNVDKLGALGELKSLTWLRKRVEKMLPKIDLPDLLFEVNAWTGFLGAFVHLGDGTTRMKDLSTSVVALLVSEACNIGLAPVVNPAHEALTRGRSPAGPAVSRRRRRPVRERPGGCRGGV